MRTRKALVVLVICLVTAAIIGYLWLRGGRIDGDGNSNASALRGETKRKLMIVWWDATKSLYPSEQENGLNWGITIISNLPSHSVYYLLPINSDTQRPSPLAQGEKPALDSADGSVLFRGALETRIKANVKKLREQMQADAEAARNDRGIVQRDRRTCLLSALENSGTILKNETRQLQPEIVIISDMVEDCFHQSLHNGNGAFIQLTQPDVDSQVRAADTLPLDLTLRDVWVTVIVPTASSEVPVIQRPDMNGLRGFWQRIFDKYGLSKEKYQWSIGLLPPRLAVPAPLDKPSESESETPETER